MQSGELTLGVDLTGTYHWTSDLNVTCTWIPDLKAGGIDVSLTDGAGKFMSIQVKTANGTHEVDVTSGALKSASMLTATSGFTMTGSNDRTHMTVTVDTDVASKDAKLHVAGKLELACPP